MGILELIVVLLTIAGLFVWNRAESRADYRHNETRMDAIRNLTDEIRKDSARFREDWLNETKEFHSRLCTIEEKGKK